VTPSAKLGTLPPDVGIAPGQLAPDFQVEDPDGRRVMFSEFSGRGAVLLTFYRGGWCPYCSFEIHALTNAYPEFRRRGVTPVAVSVDRPEKAKETDTTFEIPFPVLSDPDLRAHEAYRVVYQADAGEVSKLRGFGIDLEAASGRRHHSFAIPAFFLVDVNGRVVWAHADPSYKVRPSIEQLFDVIDSIGVVSKPEKGKRGADE
jgi:peroxiredoxin